MKRTAAILALLSLIAGCSSMGSAPMNGGGMQANSTDNVRF